ncbi:uncharacterized protein [Primulina huaijiensis]|uniref:uncharacterized protein n=1 Tax=Primulina huaijiensis TaxID=1492673 RepID=UPI003CC71B88
MIKLMGKIDVNINNVVLEKASKNAKYTSLDIQKEIFHILAERVRKKIREDVGTAKFCLLIDEAKDISDKEQMAIVLRFVDREGFLMERFFDIVHVSDTTATSPKRHTELQSAQAIEIATMVATGIRETGTGLNQIGTLQRARKTRWSSHFESICNLLCRALQEKSLDILNAMDFVSTTKDLLHTLRAEGYDILLMIVQSDCENNGIEIPDMNAWYRSATGRSSQQRDSITFEHHYRFDVFNAAIDFQVEELNSRFNDGAVELFRLSFGTSRQL